MNDNISKERLIQNEQTFKERNVEVKNVLENMLPDDTVISFVCECSNQECHEHIELTPEEYEALHANKKHYIIKIGHVTPSVEKVVLERDTFEVVEKFALNP